MEVLDEVVQLFDQAVSNTEGRARRRLAARDRQAQGPRQDAGRFAPARWRVHLDQAAADGDATGYRHCWELCVLLGLRDALRAGEV